MRTHPVPLLVVAWITALTALAALVSVAAPAAAMPSKNSTCTSCHSGAASGTVTAVPSTATPTPGATYTVAIDIGLTASGKTGYRIAQTDAADSATNWMAVYSGTGSQTAWTATMTAPATPGTYYYKVWTAKGYRGTAKAVSYSVTIPAPAPAITSLTPTHAQTGASVVIAGSNLGASGVVKFGATTATTSAWSATSVTATVPASLAPGATSVTVTPTGGSASNGLAFTVDAPPVPAPVLTSLLPSTGIAGSTVVVTGSNLGASGSVTVGGVAATTSAWSATSITCTVPAGLTTGAKSVVVTPAGATASNALTYTVTLALATITSLNPAHAQTGASVVIAGSNLGASGVVKFGATTATTSAWSATSVTATVPACLAPGATSVTVTPTGGSASNGLAFTVDAPPVPAPVLTSLLPSTGIAGSTVVVTGSNLGASGSVTVGGVAATTSAWSATQVTATVPASLAPGATTVTVQPAGAAVSNALTYTVTAAPVPPAAITSLDPTHAQTGASVVIAGTNLGPSGTVKFGATTATTSAWSATQVTATVPASLAPGATSVTVQPAGAAVSNALAFSVDAPPVPAPAITSLNPAHAQTGASVVIAGSNLGASGVVKFGATTATTSAWSATQVTATVPASLAPGATSVTVTPTGGSASNGLAFTVDAPPVPAAAIASLNPTHAQTGASVVIAGSDLGASGVVKFGATTATTSAWSATQVTATVPASLAPGATSVTVTPTGGSASNALAFTVDAPPVPVDTTAPVTTASGVPGVAWCNYPVTVSLVATDEVGGSGMKSVAYAVDGGEPIVVEGAGASVLLDTSGIHTVAFFAKDVAGNVEATRSVAVNLDLSKPHPQAPRSATARHERAATLRYRIVDETPNAGTATVTIVVKNSRGKTVLRLELGSRPVNTALKATFACRLRPGDYRFRISATDGAGNPQAAVASQRLRVLAR